MKNGGASLANRDLQTSLEMGALGGLSDGQLLDLFVAQRAEAVFEVIVRRHGPMVWGVCRRILRDHHDAEDAFQAAFLVLARKSASVHPRDKLANWLYGVAHQTALNLRASRTKRRSREVSAPDGADAPTAPAPEVDDRLALLDREVSRLPEKYRTPIVLCELEGMTHREAAERLGWPIGTVSGRLSRARAMLARRLARRGGPPPDLSLAALLARESATACVPAHLIGPTVRAASLMLLGRAATGVVVSAGVVTLTKGVLKTMLLSKIKPFAVVLLLGVMASGTAVQSYRPAAAWGNRPLTAEVGMAANPLAKFDGAWELVSSINDGTRADLSEARGRVLVFDGGRMAAIERGQALGFGTIKLNADEAPARIDWKYGDSPAKTGTSRGIYKFDADELTICLGELDPRRGRSKSRPSRFESREGSGTVLLVYRKVDRKIRLQDFPFPDYLDELPSAEAGVVAPPKLDEDEETGTTWGNEVGGLQAGLGYRPGQQRAYRHGETVRLVVRVRNVSKEAIQFQYVWAFLFENPPRVMDRDGRPVALGPLRTIGGEHAPKRVDLEAGKEIELYETQFQLSPVGTTDVRPSREAGPEVFVERLSASGKVRVQYQRLGSPDTDRTLSQLATGELELEIQPEAPAVTPSAPAVAPAAPAVAPTPPALSGRLDLRVLGPDGRPAAGAPVQYIVWTAGRPDDWDLKTDADGRLALTYDPKAAIESLLFIIRQPGTVPVYVLYDGKTPPLLVPPTKEIRLERGRVIGGVVRGEDGAPVSNALVTVTIPATEAPNTSTTLETRRATDRQGRWSFDGAPSDLARVRIQVRAEDYPEVPGLVALDLGSTTATLTRGRMIAGTVLDPDGQPVPNAHVLLGDPAQGINPRCPEDWTDAQGRFRLGGESPAATVLTVQTKGFAPALREFAADGPSLTLDPIRLEPGRTLRLRVVDAQGKPVARVGLWPGRWRGHETLRFDHGTMPATTTDAEGRFTWSDAPSDAITLDIRKDGFLSQTGVSLVAHDAEATVTLRPEIVVTGRVTDARTGALIPRFLVVEGIRSASDGAPSWAEGRGHEGHDGQLRERSGVGYSAWFLRVEAPGYRPAESRAFAPDSGSVAWDVALEPARAFGAVVVDPTGKPVPGITVGLVPRGGNVVLDGGRLSQYSQYPHFPIRKTDPEGRFEFNVPEGDHALATADPSGFAAVPVAAVQQSGRLALTPWGSIAGEVRVGARPGANEALGVEFVPPDDPAARLPVAFVANERYRADAQGRFRIDHAIPGPAVVRRLIVQEFDGGLGSMHVAGWRTPTVVRSGATSTITVGGQGRAVIGEVVAGSGLPGPIDLSETIAIAVTPGPLDIPEVYGRGVAAALVGRDGRFRIDDLAPGRYTLYGSVGLPKVGDQFRSAHLGHDFEISPGGPADPPVDLGRVVPEVDKP